MLLKIVPVAVAAWVLSSVPILAQTVQWDTDNSISSGNYHDIGKPKQICENFVTTFTVASGNDLSVIFSDFGIDLPAGGLNKVLTARARCSVQVPVQVPLGYYIGEVRETLSYGATKTAGATGTIQVKSTFFNYSIPPYKVEFPYGSSGLEPLQTVVNIYKFPEKKWCSSKHKLKDVYETKLSISGQRRSYFEDLIIQVQSLDVGVRLFRCS